MINSSLRRVLYWGMMLAVSLGSGLALSGQQAGAPALYEESVRSFEEGKFRVALDGFLLLKETQPSNAMNNYYSGRCLVELNEELDEAIEFLFSASRRGGPDDALFYLARAYHLDYNFSEARKNYISFEHMATKQQAKDLRVNHMISTCQSALDITATYNQYEVMALTFIDLTDSANYSQIRMKGGQLQRKPSEYFKLKEARDGLGSLMFMPSSLQRGDYIFYAAPGKSGKEGMQIFRVRRGSGRWGDPQELKDLNTEGNELLPYYDPIENDLYFASDGGSGIGGYDLFRSHFDSERDKWTKPINLGFPINSAMDDFLLLPGSDLGMMMFFSNRQGTDSTLTVYRVHMVEPKLKSDPNDTEKLSQIATLGGVADDLLAEMEKLSKAGGGGGDIQAEKGGYGQGSSDSQVYTPVRILPASQAASPENVPVSSSGGSEFLTEALMHQQAADSLNDLAGKARKEVQESDDPNDRWVWQKQIMVWEKKSHDEQILADELYANSEGAGPATQAAVLVVAGEPGTQPEIKTMPDNGRDLYINRFDILGASPYSKNNPIPSDVALPDGVFYRIQLGAYGSAVDPNTFGGLSPITAEIILERGLIKYYAGKFSKYEDASSALPRVRSQGYEDAFVSAWHNGIPVSTEKAKKFE